MTRHDRSLYVEREVLEGPVRIDAYIEQTLKQAV